MVGAYGNNNNAIGKLVSNIIINSGVIKSVGSGHAPGIGGSNGTTVNNIVINGGNINALGSGYGAGIGTDRSISDNIIINGGKIYAAGGTIGSSIEASGTIQINGGSIIVYDILPYPSASPKGLIGNKVVISGGTIKATSTKYSGIACEEGGSINITGGNVVSIGKDFGIGTYEGSTLVSYNPKRRNKQFI